MLLEYYDYDYDYLHVPSSRLSFGSCFLSSISDMGRALLKAAAKEVQKAKQ